MNKQEKKALWRARQEADEEASAKSRERRIGEDPVWRGAGLLLFQLQEWPEQRRSQQHHRGSYESSDTLPCMLREAFPSEDAHAEALARDGGRAGAGDC